MTTTVEDVLAAMERNLQHYNNRSSAWDITDYQDYFSDFDPPTLTALLAVARAASMLATGGHSLCDPQDCGFKRVIDALDALTRPPQGAGGDG